MALRLSVTALGNLSRHGTGSKGSIVVSCSIFTKRHASSYRSWDRIIRPCRHFARACSDALSRDSCALLDSGRRSVANNIANNDEKD